MPGLSQLRQFSEDIKELGDEVRIRKMRGEQPIFLPVPDVPDVDDSSEFITGMPVPSAANDTDAVDETAPEAAIDLSGIGEIPGVTDMTGSAAEEPVAIPPELSDILGGGSDMLAGDDMPDLSDFMDDPVVSQTPSEAPADSLAMPDLDDSFADFLTVPDATASLPAEPAQSGEPADEASVPAENTAVALDSISVDDIAIPEDLSLPENFGADETLEEPEDIPGLEDLGDLLGDEKPTETAAASETTATAETAESVPDDFAFSGEEIDMGSEVPSPLPAAPLDSEASPTENAVPLDQSELDKLFASSSAAAEPVAEETLSEPEPAGESLTDDSVSADSADIFDTSGLDFPDDFSAPAPSETVPDAASDVAPEIFDTSELDGLDFSADGPSASGTALPFDEEFPVTGEGGDDFELTDDFEIPGFSDTDTVPVDKKKGGFRLDSPDFSKAASDRPPNTLTEDEYERFKKNLAGYPLNLRIAVEDFIVKDEFKDDVIFEVVEKVLKKVSARQLAGHLEKLLDISIDVPRDFERRSVAEYEAYKQSFQYQLKNRILPAAVAGIVLAIFAFFLFQAGKAFVYQPLMARSLYKQGYTMLENNEYPQSEQLFEDAVQYKAIKKWFFAYAHGYREHKQYERAAQMYRNILGLFSFDKQAGLEYAEMELYERANYARAEDIVRRDVLDHYINDASGILLLGDIFLEWAEVDPEKYELARAEYSNLIQLYGGTDLYMSRMMRYFIRTDNLPNVLSLKNRFYAKKKSLGAADWTELSGYLLDKLYGNLSKTEESLRSSIEDVLDMLNTAVKLDPANPVARYNLSRYFLHNNNDASAQREMQIALDLFEKAPVRTKKNTYREINGNRILGELFSEKREYLKAQEAYTRGINVYTEEHAKTGLEGDENTGKLYADMGDLDYFITGDMDGALANYQTAISLRNDTPSLNYRIGAIHYNRKNYDKALGSFIRTSETKGNDPSLLLSLGNTLSLRGDNFAAQGYYADLITRLNNERTRRVVLSPQIDEDDNTLVEMFLKANNNLGVTLYRLARQTGDSAKNAEAMVRLSDSMRAWDALTRNPETMVRLEGSNLASQNAKYITHPYSDFEPAIYTDIPKVLSGEAGLE